MTSNNMDGHSEDGHCEGDVEDKQARSLLVSQNSKDVLSLCDTIGLDDDEVEYRMFRTFSDPGEQEEMPYIHIPGA